MPRIARIKVSGEAAVYHVMSRTALDGSVLGDAEKDFHCLTPRHCSIWIHSRTGPVLSRWKEARSVCEKL